MYIELLTDGTFFAFFRGSVQLQGSLINGIESRLTEVEGRLSDLDARGSEEHNNLANERDLHRFILSGKLLDG